MEGLIPLIYRAILQYKSGGSFRGFTGGGAWFSESPSLSYMRLPGDSGRFQLSASTDLPFFHPTSSPSTSRGLTSSAAAQVIISSRVQSSPISRMTTSRRAAA
ncbi:hypothetical protein SAY86_028603 [Trapa natans]|uniref:Uncharacterized protein n=1 Tax=Trapa natans TaxID=22666 RepID=A0AAN7RAX0_TRANT|nr:hypothetical protein SAY86_028603 [Trapa natans]